MYYKKIKGAKNFIKRTMQTKKEKVFQRIATSLFIIGLLFCAYVFVYREYIQETVASPVIIQFKKPEIKPVSEYYNFCENNNVACNELMNVKTTGFSSVECRTTWCQAHAGEPRGLRVALNKKKFGAVRQVYVPEWNETYDVIGTTDSKTDMDIWYGDEYENALIHGKQWVDIILIK
jgi:hypothetical protein